MRTFIGSIAPQLINDLQLSIAKFTLLGSAYYIAYGLMQVPVGILTDRFGVKRVMILAILICVLSTLLFSYSHSFIAALLGRFFMGFGSSFAFVCLLVILSNWLPKRLSGFFTGASQFIGTIGPVLAGGPLISWLNHTQSNWRVALSDIGISGLALALVALLFVKNKPRGDRNNLLFSAKNELLLVRLKNLLKTKQAWIVAINSAVSYVAIAEMATFWGTKYLQIVGLSQNSAAYIISIMWIAYAIGCPTFGFLSDLIKRRKLFLVLCALLGLVSMSLILYGHFTEKAIYSVLFFTLGLAATGNNIGFVAIVEHTDYNIRASAFGLNNGMITLVDTLLPLIISYLIYMANGSSDARHVSLHSFIFGLSLLSISYLLSLIISVFFFKETYCRPQKELLFLERSAR